MKYILFLLFWSPFIVSFAQAEDYFQSKGKVDSVAYSKDYDFTEGIYLTIDQFKKNSPVPKSAIISNCPKTEIDFLSQVLSQKYLVFKDSVGNEHKMETSNIWGYCKNRVVYVNGNIEYTNIFIKLSVIGKLCYFTNVDQVGSSIFFSKQLMINTNTNQILEFNVSNLEEILKTDTDLYNQFMKLKEFEKPNSIFIYLRKYNEKNPLYLPAK